MNDPVFVAGQPGARAQIHAGVPGDTGDRDRERIEDGSTRRGTVPSDSEPGLRSARRLSQERAEEHVGSRIVAKSGAPDLDRNGA